MPFIGKSPQVGAFQLIDSITTSATDTYALTVSGSAYVPESARNLIVSLNGVTQAPESAYTVSGSNIVFASALTASDVIDYILVIGDAVDIGTPSDNTVGDAQLKPSLNLSSKTLTFANDQISGDVINGGTISSFASTGIDDNATSTALTVTDSGIAATLTTAAQPNITSVGTLSSLSVTGDLTADTNTLFVDSTNNRVGIGTASPDQLLDVGDHTAVGNRSIRISQRTGTSGQTYGGLEFYMNNTAGTEVVNAAIKYSTGPLRNDGELTFHTGTAGTISERVRIDHNGNVGIGTSSPSTKLHLGGTAPLDSIIRQDSTVSGTNWEIGERAAGKWQIWEDDSDSVVATFTSTGLVGIGTTSPVGPLSVVAASGGGAIDVFGRSADGLGWISFKTNNGSSSHSLIGTPIADTLAFYTNGFNERMRIDSSGKVGIGTTTINNPLTVHLTPNTNSKTSGSAFDGGAIRLTSTNGLSGTNSEMAILAGAEDTLSAGIGFARQFGGDWGTQIRFYTHGTAITTPDELTERMRIDASGNLLVGTTSAAGHFTNGLPTATLSTGSTGGTTFTRTHRASASNNATVDAFRFLDANGNVNNGYINGHLYVTVVGSSGLYSSTRMYYIQTNSNSTSNANFTLLSTATRGVDPVSSIAMVADGSGGAVKIQVTYINNSGVVTGGSSTISFIGQA